MKKILTHPKTGVRLVLDSAEICPNDPGNGTPAIVEYRGGTSTLTCAENEGYVSTYQNGDYKIPVAALRWLESEDVQNEVEAMYKAGPKGIW